MADILAFPSQRAQALAYLDRELRQLLLHKGADQALIDFAKCHNMPIVSIEQLHEHLMFADRAEAC